MIRLRVLSVVLACGLLGPAALRAQDTRYAALEIRNATTNITITYSIRWGNAAWKEFTVKPGAFNWHSYTNEFPEVRLSFNPGISRALPVKEYKLDHYESRYQKKMGKPFHFETRKDKDGEEYVDLFDHTGYITKCLQRGRDLSAARDYEKAILEFTEAIRVGPNMGPAFYYERGAAYGALGKNAEAVQDFTDAIRFTPDFPAYPNARGVAYFRMKRYDDALADFNEALRLKSDHADAFANRGAVYYRTQQYELSVRESTEAIRLNPKIDRAYVWRALAYTKLGDKAQAKINLDKAIELNAANQRDFERELGEITVAAKSSPAPAADINLVGSTWSGAETLKGYGDVTFRFQKEGKVVMADKDGDTPGAWNRLGNSVTMRFGAGVLYTGAIDGSTMRGSAKSGERTWTFTIVSASGAAQEGRDLTKLGQLDKAIAKFNEAIRANPKDAVTYTWRAFAYLENKDYDKALADCTEALRLNNRLSNAYNVRGLLNRAQGEFDEAVKDHSEAIRLLPKNAVLLANRGLAHTSQKSYEEAIKDHSDAIELNPKEPIYRVWRGQAYFEKKSYEQALEDYSEAIRMQPERPANHNFRGLAYFRAERYAEAIADYTEAIRLDAKFAFAFSNRGAAYFMKKDYPAALKDCTEAIRINPKVDRAYFWRGQAYAKLGDAVQARLDYEKAVQLNPANQKLRADVENAGKTFAPVANREEARRALRTFRLGSTITPKQLLDINKLAQELKYLDRVQNPVPAETRQLINNEKRRHELLEPEMVAAADRFLTAAKLSPAARQAEGLDLQWLYGPATWQKDDKTGEIQLKRAGADDLSGMRLVGRLILKDKREITVIIPITFFPNIGDEETRGHPGILWGADNFRVLVKMFNEDKIRASYAHQSFSVNNKEDGTQTMRPGLNINVNTGMLVDPYVQGSSLGTRCFDCHGDKGTNITRYYDLMQRRDYANMKGFKGLLELAKEMGATDRARDDLKAAMLKDPALLIPLDELQRANEEYWIRRYPAFKQRLRNAAPKQSTRRPVFRVFDDGEFSLPPADGNGMLPATPYREARFSPVFFNPFFGRDHDAFHAAFVSGVVR